MSQIQRIVSRGCLILKLGLIIILLDVRVYFLNSLYLLVYLLFSFSFFKITIYLIRVVYTTSVINISFIK